MLNIQKNRLNGTLRLTNIIKFIYTTKTTPNIMVCYDS